MSDQSTTIWYILTTVIIIMIIFAAARIFSGRAATRQISPTDEYIILVDTPRGLIRVNNTEAADELEWILRDIQAHKATAYERPGGTNMPGFRESLAIVVNNLKKFVNINTTSKAYSNEEILLGTKAGEMEINAEIVHNTGILRGNLLNEPMSNLDGENDSESTNFIVNDDYSAAKKLNIVCDNMSVVIELLRQRKCSEGKLDINALYKLQNQIRANVGCKKGKCRCNCQTGVCLRPRAAPAFANTDESINLSKFADYKVNRNDDDGVQSYNYINYSVDNALGSDKENNNTDYSAGIRVNPGGNTLDKYSLLTANSDLNSKENHTPYADKPNDMDLTDKRILQNAVPYEQHYEGLTGGRDGFNTNNTNTVIEKYSHAIKNRDRNQVNYEIDNMFSDTFSAFIRANPQGWLLNRDIEPRDFLGYRLTGSFQRSLYDYTDSYRQKFDRCVKNKYAHLEDDTIFDRCMGIGVE